MNLASELLYHVISELYAKNPLEMEFFSTWVDKNLPKTLKPVLDREEFARIAYAEAVTILQKNGMVSTNINPEFRKSK